MARIKTAKVEARQLPQSIEEVDALVAELGELQRQLEKLGLDLNQSIEQLKATAVTTASPIQDQMTAIIDQISAYAGVRRDELTEGGKRKTVFLRSGELRWRTTPPAVNIASIEKVLAALQALGLTRFIRNKPEVDKEAMLRERDVADAVEGVSITQREEFVIVPSDTQIEVVKKGEVIKGTPAG